MAQSQKIEGFKVSLEFDQDGEADIGIVLDYGKRTSHGSADGETARALGRKLLEVADFHDQVSRNGIERTKINDE